MNHYFENYINVLEKNFMLVIIGLILLIPTFFIRAGILFFIIGITVASITNSQIFVYLGFIGFISGKRKFVKRKDDYEDYINYISDIPAFEPYNKTVFALEELSGGITNVPIEEVKAMYNEMKTVFDYVLVSEYPLVYRGYYEGETSFVDGYEQYQTADIDMEISNTVNVVSRDWEGDDIVTTPLKTVLLGESIFNRFDSSIEKGRNLQMSDFTLAAPNEPISVV